MAKLNVLKARWGVSAEAGALAGRSSSGSFSENMASKGVECGGEGRGRGGSVASAATDSLDSGSIISDLTRPSAATAPTTLFRQGGRPSSSITNLNGIANNITINQGGAGKHTLEIIGAAGSQNNGNNITATQTGGVGADKTFNLGLNGWNTNVTIEQTNPTTAGQASMNISCGNSCGTQPWSYISR
jgi:hypothetical protein